MTHDEIAAGNIVDRYLMGKLSAEETAGFEEHFVDCPACLDQLEAVERFRAAMKPLVRETARAWPQRWQSAWPVAAAIAITLGAWLFFAAREAALQQELQQARAAAGEARRRPAPTGDAPAPLVASTFYLTITRGSDTNASEPVNRVTAAGPGWVALSLEGEVETGFESLRAAIRDSAGKDVWRQDGLRAVPHEALSVILPPGVLHPGDCVLTLEGLSRGRYVAAGRYRFRVTAR